MFGPTTFCGVARDIVPETAKMKLHEPSDTEPRVATAPLISDKDDEALARDILERPHPQTSFAETTVDPNSFFGRLRLLYSSVVLQTQLDQMKKQGSYKAFDLQWQDVYNVRRTTGGRSRPDGIPPSLFWESDVGKWIEAVCYFLASPDTATSPKAPAYRAAMNEMVDLIVKAQAPDGYIGIYFRVVDPDGKMANLRDMHEMYNLGHLLEGSMAHYRLTKSKKFLNVMIKAVDCFMRKIGPNEDQLHGYPGHPELELAVLRLYALTKDPKHFAFGQYLLKARGVKRKDQHDLSFFDYEARYLRKDPGHSSIPDLKNGTYTLSHAPILEQDQILGHSVRALYLITAAADLGGELGVAARRLWDDATGKKMYSTGGFGTKNESVNEGGCYAETCAAIAAVMTSERLLSHKLDGHVRDVMELSMMNAVINGGSLDGKGFSYENRHATCRDETAIREEWFEVCCCPPNLSRTLGMIGGYAWSTNVSSKENIIRVSVYLFLSGTRTIPLPDGQKAMIEMQTEMPWKGRTQWTMSAPEGWTWELALPAPEYAEAIKISSPAHLKDGFYHLSCPFFSANVKMTFDMPIRLLSPHPATRQDTLTVSRGPITYAAEDVDNCDLEDAYPHFENIGLSETATFSEGSITIHGFELPTLTTKGKSDVYAQQIGHGGLYRPIQAGKKSAKTRAFTALKGQHLTFIPWFSRSNRGGKGHLRVSMLRVQNEDA